MKFKPWFFVALAWFAASPAWAGNLFLIIAGNALTEEQMALLNSKLNAEFRYPVIINTSFVKIDDAYNPDRAQYDAQKLLAHNNLFREGSNNYYMMVIADDIYIEPYNFVFAQTEFEPLRTVISTARLHSNFLDRIRGKNASQLLIQRIHKLFLRRIGVAFHISEECGPMIFSNGIRELDKKAESYCEADAAKLRALGVLK